MTDSLATGLRCIDCGGALPLGYTLGCPACGGLLPVMGCARGLGAVINNSRGIIFAHARPEFAQRFGAARWQEAVAAATREMIEQLRAETTVGML